MISVRKLKLIIINENEELRKEQYKFIRDSQYAQYQALNLGMGYIMTGYLVSNRDIKSEEFKEHQKNLKNKQKKRKRNLKLMKILIMKKRQKN